MSEIVELIGTVTNLSSQSGTTSQGPNKGKPWLRHDVFFTDESGAQHKPVFFRRDERDDKLLEKVQGLAGQKAKVKMAVVEREGRPSNIYLNEIEGVNGAAPAGTPLRVGSAIPAQSSLGPVVALNSPSSAVLATTSVRDKGDEIRAMWAIKTAATYVSHNGSGNAESDTGLIMEMAKTFYNSDITTPEASDKPSW